jgi:hypothetical protein
MVEEPTGEGASPPPPTVTMMMMMMKVLDETRLPGSWEIVLR